jgi:hypothetical protein
VSVTGQDAGTGHGTPKSCRHRKAPACQTAGRCVDAAGLRTRLVPLEPA